MSVRRGGGSRRSKCAINFMHATNHTRASDVLNIHRINHRRKAHTHVRRSLHISWKTNQWPMCSLVYRGRLFFVKILRQKLSIQSRGTVSGGARLATCCINFHHHLNYCLSQPLVRAIQIHFSSTAATLPMPALSWKRAQRHVNESLISVMEFSIKILLMFGSPANNDS